jgi:RNA polymerase sigma-70 factor (ECF subfamily)
VNAVSTPDERLLVTRATAGDEEAFRLLVIAHRERIHRLARLYVRRPQDAVEIAQQVFVRLHRALRTFRHDAALSTWLHRVTVNLCRDALRRERRDRRLVPIDEARDVPAGPASDPEIQSIRRASDRDVHAAIAALPPPLRELIALRFGSGLTHAEIAGVLDIPLGTVCTRMQRALAHLSTALSESAAQEPTP